METTIIKFDNHEDRNKRILSTLFVLGCMVFVILLSVFVFSKNSLRLDESQSLWQTSKEPFNIIKVVAEDVHLPLYHLSLYIWRNFFGNGVDVDRYLSLTYFVFTIPVVYLLSKLAFNRKVAWYATLLFSISAFLNWYANEIRMYTLLTLMTVLSHYFFVRIIKKNDLYAWVGYTIALIIGFFTHYFFLFVIFSQVTFYLFNRKSFKKGSLKNFLIVIAFCLLFYVPWIRFFISLGAASSTKPLLAKPSSVDLFNAFSQFLFGFQTNDVNTLLVSLWPIITLLIFLFLRNNKKVPRIALYFFFATVIPIAIAFSLSLLVRPLFLTRYLIIALPSLYIFVSWLFSSYTVSVARVLKSLLLIGMIATLGLQIVSAKSPVEENYQEAVQYIQDRESSRDIVVVSVPFTLYPVEYYYTGVAALTSLPIWDQNSSSGIPPFDAAQLPKEVDSIAKDHDNLWVLYSYDQGYEKNIKSYFDQHLQKLNSKVFSQGLSLYQYTAFK